MRNFLSIYDFNEVEVYLLGFVFSERSSIVLENNSVWFHLGKVNSDVDNSYLREVKP